MRETIEIVVKALVDDAEAVDVREVERNGTTRIEIRVAQPDMGKSSANRAARCGLCVRWFMPPD